MNLELRKISRTALCWLLGLNCISNLALANTNLPNYDAYCLALFVDKPYTYGVTKAIAVEGLLKAAIQGRLKLRRNAKARNKEIARNEFEFLRLREAVLGENGYDLERISSIFNKAKKELNEFEARIKFRSRPHQESESILLQMQHIYTQTRLAIENSLTTAEIEFYRNHLISELQRLVSSYKKSINERLEIIAELKSYIAQTKLKSGGFFIAEVNKAIQWRVSELHVDSPAEELRLAATTLRQEITEGVSKYRIAESARRESERRFELSQSGNEDLIWQSFESNLQHFGLYSLLTDSELNSELMIKHMALSPELKSFVYREMRLLQIFKTKGSKPNHLGLRIKNDLKILAMWPENDLKTKYKATAWLKLISNFRDYLNSYASLRIFAETLPFLSLKEWSPKTTEEIVAEAINNPMLTRVLMNLSVEIPQNPEPPPRPIEPAFPESLQQSFVAEMAGKTARGIQNFVNLTRSEIERYRLAHDKYVEDVRLLPQRHIDYKARLKLLQDMQLRKESAEQTWFAFIVFKFPEFLLADSESQKYLDPIAKQFIQVLKQRLSRLRKKGKQLYLNSKAADSQWNLFASTANPMWLFSPDFTQFQLLFDLRSGSTRKGSTAHSYELAQRELFYGGQSTKDIESARDQYAKVNREMIALGKMALHENSTDFSLRGMADLLRQLVTKEEVDPTIDLEEERAPQYLEPESAARIAAEAHIAAENEIARAREESLKENVEAEQEAQRAQAKANLIIRRTIQTLEAAAQEANQILRRQTPVINVDFPGDQ